MKLNLITLLEVVFLKVCFNIFSRFTAISFVATCSKFINITIFTFFYFMFLRILIFKAMPRINFNQRIENCNCKLNWVFSEYFLVNEVFLILWLQESRKVRKIINASGLDTLTLVSNFISKFLAVSEDISFN